MGTHAWMFIEWRESSSRTWQATSEDSLHLSRNYRIFDALAGGRSGTGHRYPHRGLPKDISDIVLKRAYWRLTNSGEELQHRPPGETVVKRQDDMRPPRYKMIRRNGVQYVLPVNGWLHSHTWLTLAEINESLQQAGIAATELNDYATLLTQMSELESAGKKVRLLLWFDGGPMRSGELTDESKLRQWKSLIVQRCRQWKEAAEELLKESLARAFYCPRPLRQLKLPKGFQIQPYWDDKGQFGQIIQLDESYDEPWLFLYLYGDYYELTAREMHCEFEKAYGPHIELRELPGPSGPAILRIYRDSRPGKVVYEAVLDSARHSLQIQTGMQHYSSIDKFVALFDVLWKGS